MDIKSFIEIKQILEATGYTLITKGYATFAVNVLAGTVHDLRLSYHRLKIARACGNIEAHELKEFAENYAKLMQ